MNGWKFETVTIVVPSKDRDGTPWSDDKHDRIVTEVMGYMANLFNGATASAAKGIWYDPETGTAITENVTRVESWVDPSGVDDHTETLTWYCKNMQCAWNQGEVALIIGQTYYGIMADNESEKSDADIVDEIGGW